MGRQGKEPAEKSKTLWPRAWEALSASRPRPLGWPRVSRPRKSPPLRFRGLRLSLEVISGASDRRAALGALRPRRGTRRGLFPSSNIAPAAHPRSMTTSRGRDPGIPPARCVLRRADAPLRTEAFPAEPSPWPLRGAHGSLPGQRAIFWSGSKLAPLFPRPRLCQDLIIGAPHNGPGRGESSLGGARRSLLFWLRKGNDTKGDLGLPLSPLQCNVPLRM